VLVAQVIFYLMVCTGLACISRYVPISVRHRQPDPNVFHVQESSANTVAFHVAAPLFLCVMFAVLATEPRRPDRKRRVVWRTLLVHQAALTVVLLRWVSIRY
jgi:hypothetical protein